MRRGVPSRGTLGCPGIPRLLQVVNVGAGASRRGSLESWRTCPEPLPFPSCVRGQMGAQRKAGGLSARMQVEAGGALALGDPAASLLHRSALTQLSLAVCTGNPQGCARPAVASHLAATTKVGGLLRTTPQPSSYSPPYQHAASKPWLSSATLPPVGGGGVSTPVGVSVRSPYHPRWGKGCLLFPRWRLGTLSRCGGRGTCRCL